MNRSHTCSAWPRWLIAVLLLSPLVAGCGGSSGRDPVLETGGNVGVAPVVTGVTPLDTASDVSTNTAVITAAFSEPMAPITGAASFTVTCSAPCSSPVGTAALNSDNTVAAFTLAPATQLAPLTLYTARLTGARSLATGIPLASTHTWSFTTGLVPETVAPVVSSTSPLSNDSGVAINTLIAASFSEPMNPLTATAATFTLACPAGTSVTGTVGYAVNGNVATFTPASNLPANTICTATIAAGVEDVAANGMIQTYHWSFTTGLAPDSTAPAVSSVSPFANDSGIAINGLVSATFSEPMNPLTVTAADFTLSCPAGTPVTGAVAYAVNGNVATFSPASNLPPNTLCTARITTGVRDVAENAMAAVASWTFTTGAAPDAVAPMVSSTSPFANETGVAINTAITASFSEPMNPLTITAASFTLACPSGTPVAGTVGYAVNGNVGTFTAASALPASTVCTARITTGVEDVAGNAMAAAATWNFTNGLAPDVAAPTVSSTSPSAGDSGVAINTLITATFSEPMNPLTVTSASFTLACPAGTPITGTVGYAVNGNVATFTPASALPASTVCTARLTTGVKDVAGNAMAAFHSWTFTTGVAPDITSPTVSSTSPAASDTNVAINASITASFSEPMNPLTITTASFTLACPSGTPVAGTVGYAVNGNVATFTPTSALPAGTICAALVSTAAKDVAGNAMATAASWTFTTGATPDITAPTVSSTSPFANQTGLAIN